MASVTRWLFLGHLNLEVSNIILVGWIISSYGLELKPNHHCLTHQNTNTVTNGNNIILLTNYFLNRSMELFCLKFLRAGNKNLFLQWKWIKSLNIKTVKKNLHFKLSIFKVDSTLIDLLRLWEIILEIWKIIGSISRNRLIPH